MQYRVRTGFVSLLLSITCTLQAAGQTILIDYDDGIANGNHEASVRNGGFEESNTGETLADTPYWEDYFPGEGPAAPAIFGDHPRAGALHALTSGYKETGDRVHPSQTIPAAAWTIAEGDVFAVSFWVRAGVGFDPGSDRVQLLIHVVNGSGQTIGNRLHQADFDVPEADTYYFCSTVSEPVPAGSSWIGHQVQLRILVIGDRDERLLIDDVTWTAGSAQDFPATLLAHYPANSNAQDFTTNGYHGVPVGDLDYGDGFGQGQAFAFNGTSSAASIPHLVPSSFSIAFWMNASDPGRSGPELHWWDGDGLVDGRVDGSAHDFGISLRGSKVVFGVEEAGGNARTIFSRTRVADGAWHHVVATRDQLTGAMQLFIDRYVEATGVGSVSRLTGPPSLRIGSLQDGSGFFAGRIDEVRLYEGVLTTNEIEAIYVGEGDTDGDGQDNEEEAAAGTDWGDAGEWFRVGRAAFSNISDRLDVRIDGKDAHRYRLWRSPENMSSNWTEVTVSDVLYEDAPVVLSDADIPDRAFYRVSVEEEIPPRPNILIMITDDQGYGDLSAYAHHAADVSTPGMDRIATNGVLFTQAYVTAPVCSPSRTGWNTGRYQQEWNKAAGWGPGLPGSVTHLAEYLRRAGYQTAKFGKSDYGQGYHNLSAREYPLNHGFEEFLGFSAHAHDYWLHSQATADATPDPNGSSAHLGPLQHNNEYLSLPDGSYLTEVITDRAISFLQQQPGTNTPFFLTVSYNSVHHLIHEVPQEYLDRFGVPYIADYDPGTDTTENPDRYGEYYGRYNKVGAIGDADMRKYYLANLACLDDNIGRLLDEIESLGLHDRTLLFFIVDNGGSPLTGANNGPLSGSKYNLFEGGIRIPFMMRWPGRLPEGGVYDHVVSTLDIVPTCLEVARVKNAPNLRGQSLIRPVQTGEPVEPGERTLFWKWQSGNWAIRRGDWKLVKSGKGTGASATSQVHFNDSAINKVSLFNLAEDPGETNNLVDVRTDIRDELQDLYNSWHDSL